MKRANIISTFSSNFIVIMLYSNISLIVCLGLSLVVLVCPVNWHWSTRPWTDPTDSKIHLQHSMAPIFEYEFNGSLELDHNL